jgi:hypothetical protein
LKGKWSQCWFLEKKFKVRIYDFTPLVLAKIPLTPVAEDTTAAPIPF